MGESQEGHVLKYLLYGLSLNLKSVFTDAIYLSVKRIFDF